jgi:hypothetical protein
MSISKMINNNLIGRKKQNKTKKNPKELTTMEA